MLSILIAQTQPSAHKTARIYTALINAVHWPTKKAGSPIQQQQQTESQAKPTNAKA